MMKSWRYRRVDPDLLDKICSRISQSVLATAILLPGLGVPALIFVPIVVLLITAAVYVGLLSSRERDDRILRQKKIHDLENWHKIN